MWTKFDESLAAATTVAEVATQLMYLHSHTRVILPSWARSQRPRWLADMQRLQVRPHLRAEQMCLVHTRLVPSAHLRKAPGAGPDTWFWFWLWQEEVAKPAGDDEGPILRPGRRLKGLIQGLEGGVDWALVERLWAVRVSRLSAWG